MSSIFRPYRQTYIEKKSTGEVFESIRIPNVPVYHREGFTEVLELDEWLSDKVDLSGDFYQSFIREYEEAFKLEDEVTVELKKALIFNYTEVFNVSDSASQRITERFEVSYTDDFVVEDTMSSVKSTPQMISYTDTFNLEDSVSNTIWKIKVH